jgi:uncharacterized membrane protein HdeD (DUF308 family)
MDSTAYVAPAAPSNSWWLILLQGVALLIIGVLLFTETEITLFLLVMFLGVYWLIGGIFDLVSLFTDQADWGWRLFAGIIGILAGLVIVRHPLWATIMVPSTLVWVLAAFGIAIGVVTLIRAVTGAGWGAAILGAISLLFGVILLLNPLFSATVLLYAAATGAIVGGVASIMWALWLRSLRRDTERNRLKLVRTAPIEK